MKKLGEKMYLITLSHNGENFWRTPCRSIPLGFIFPHIPLKPMQGKME